MSKIRVVNTRFWTDDYISNLDPTEKLLFLYLITNPTTEICGIYEIPLKYMAMETGIDSEMVIRILKRFTKDKKIIYKDGWVIINNFAKHQSYNPSVKIGIEKSLAKVPPKIRELFDSLQPPPRLGTASPQSEPGCGVPEPEPEPEPEPVPELLTPSKPAVPFSEFWQIYPKKVERKKATEKWLRLTYEMQQEILADIPRRLLGRQWVQGYIPNPTTYLTGERWNDDIETSSSGSLILQS